MATLKSSIKNISTESEDLIRDYINLFSIKQSEKLALLLALLSSVFIMGFLFFIIIIILSFAIVAYLNGVLSSNYLGYIIISGAYLLAVVIIILKIIFTKKPFLTNLFVKFILSIFSISISYSKNFSGVNREIERIENEIDKNKIKIKADAQIIKYLVLESFIKEFFGLFKSKSKKSEANDNVEDNPIVSDAVDDTDKDLD